MRQGRDLRGDIPPIVLLGKAKALAENNHNPHTTHYLPPQESPDAQLGTPRQSWQEPMLIWRVGRAGLTKRRKLPKSVPVRAAAKQHRTFSLRRQRKTPLAAFAFVRQESVKRKHYS